LISGFSRLQAVGEKGSAVLRCGASGVAMTEAGCQDHVMAFTVPYELTGIDAVVPAGEGATVLAP
jgi:hypothetical protein